MKRLYRIIRGLFAIIGLLTVILLVWMKNTYWFMCEEELTYGVEDHSANDANRGRMLNLIPAGFVPFGTWDNSVNTTNAKLFWAKPEGER